MRKPYRSNSCCWYDYHKFVKYCESNGLNSLGNEYHCYQTKMIYEMIQEIRSLYIICDNFKKSFKKLKEKSKIMDKKIEKIKKENDKKMENLVKLDKKRDKKLDKCDKIMDLTKKKK